MVDDEFKIGFVKRVLSFIELFQESCAIMALVASSPEARNFRMRTGNLSVTNAEQAQMFPIVSCALLRLSGSVTHVVFRKVKEGILEASKKIPIASWGLF